MFALHVEIVGARGIRERRRIAEDQVVVPAVGEQPLHRIGLHEAVTAAADAVLLQVVGQPLQVRAGEIDARRARCAAARANDFDVQRVHVRLLRAALMRLAPGGALYFSNNFRRFRLDEDALSDIASIEDVTPATIPPDFERNARIHKCWRMRRLGMDARG